MKVFQILNDVCHWDATPQFPTVKSTVGYFSPEVRFVEAPDYVFEGWGYLDGQFIRPTPPEGWLYDEATGTFYPEDADPPERQYTAEQKLQQQLTDAELERIELGQQMTDLELMILGGDTHV